MSERLADESDRYTPELATAEDVNWACNGAWKRPLAFVLLKLNKNSISEVIEFGCGSGLFACHLPAEVKYLGVDRCQLLLEKAKRRSPDRSFLAQDVRAPLKSHCDLSCAWSFMKHFALDEWDQVLAKVLSAGRLAAFDCQVAEKDFDDGADYPHVFVTAERVRRAVAAAGYAVEAEEVFSEFKVGERPAKTVAYWCRRRQTEGDEVRPDGELYENTAPDQPQLLSRQYLTVGGVSVLDLHRYSLRWAEEEGRRMPSLFRDGRRVTQSWRLEMDVTVPEDEKGASA